MGRGGERWKNRPQLHTLLVDVGEGEWGDPVDSPGSCLDHFSSYEFTSSSQQASREVLPRCLFCGLKTPSSEGLSNLPKVTQLSTLCDRGRIPALRLLS